VTNYVLDTDHVTLQQRFHPAVLQRLHMLREADTVAVTIITFEEQIRGRLDIVRRHGTSARQIAAYTALHQTFRYFQTWQVLDFTQAAFDQFIALRRQKIRIGSQDLRIAAIALTLNATLVTRNQRDFGQVPGLAIEDWSNHE
jgi:tRNA(fMet)-specific endonuclease VapC